LQSIENEDGKHMFKGVQLNGSDSSFQASKNKFLNSLQSSLAGRFEDVDEGVIKATSVVSFSTWPNKENSEGLQHFVCY